MKYNNNEQHTESEDRLVTDVISSFRSFSPSYQKTKLWYLENKPQVAQKKNSAPFLSKYSLPIFGSVFASAFALVMILTSQNGVIQSGEMAVQIDTFGLPEERLAKQGDEMPVTFSSFSSDGTGGEMMMAKTAMMQEPTVLEKLEMQSQASSRTQADEDFTEVLEIEPSFEQLFQ